MINNNKKLFVNSLNIFYNMPDITFVSLGFCEIMTLLNKSLLLHWTTMCGFPGADTKNTSLRYLEAKLWHITLTWRPFWILSSSGKRTRWNLGDFKYVDPVGFNTPK